MPSELACAAAGSAEHVKSRGSVGAAEVAKQAQKTLLDIFGRSAEAACSVIDDSGAYGFGFDSSGFSGSAWTSIRGGRRDFHP